MTHTRLLYNWPFLSGCPSNGGKAPKTTRSTISDRVQTVRKRIEYDQLRTFTSPGSVDSVPDPVVTNSIQHLTKTSLVT